MPLQLHDAQNSNHAVEEQQAGRTSSCERITTRANRPTREAPHNRSKKVVSCISLGLDVLMRPGREVLAPLIELLAPNMACYFTLASDWHLNTLFQTLCVSHQRIIICRPACRYTAHGTRVVYGIFSFLSISRCGFTQTEDGASQNTISMCTVRRGQLSMVTGFAANPLFFNEAERSQSPHLLSV